MSLIRLFSVPRLARSSIQSLYGRHLVAPADGAPRFQFQAAARTTRDIWRARDLILRFLRTGDTGLALTLRQRFGLTHSADHVPLLPDDLFCNQDPTPVDLPATVIVPIFNAAAALERLLRHLPQTTDPKQKIILIDDGSTDPRIAELLEGFQSRHGNCTVLRRKTNQGFVASVNAGLALVDADHHVILLNSDTLPPKGWVPRLLVPIAGDDTVASVTPVSNHAQILSVPGPEIEVFPTTDMVRQIDRVAKALRHQPIEVPTGVGFCMAVNRRFLDDIGGFDPSFGRGYGEEVDWCQKASAQGGRHVATPNLFVGHDGGASFGNRERARRTRRAMQVLTSRYPGFLDSARKWQQADPMGAERLALAIAWIGATSTGRTPLYLAHSLGGGAELALQAEVSDALARGQQGVLILRVGGPYRWRLELKGPRYTLSGDIDNTGLLHELLEPLRSRQVIYSCGVGAKNPGDVPEALLHLSEGHGLSIRLHDFFPISPSWNLLGSNGRYEGVPSVDTRDPVHSVANGTMSLSHADWRSLWSKVVSRADGITAFAESGRDIFVTAYPEAQGKTVVRPHKTKVVPRPVPRGGHCLGVLGGINRAKGGEVLERLARHLDRPIVLIGELDGAFRLQPPHRVHGRYDPKEISNLATRYDIGAWLIPSIWPETFSFATHEALATGLPVASFDLGGQAEALRPAPNGYVLNVDPFDIPALADHIARLFSLP